MKRKIKKPKKIAKPPAEPFIIGIGASAGGLEALRALFGSLTTVDNLVFIVVQHLAPLYQSRLVELISHATQVKVRELRDRQELVPGTAYITPPNRDVLFDESGIHLTRPHAKIGPKPSVDLFFNSLAQFHGSRAVGVILSGTGSDGSLGIQEIKSSGGLTVIQSPESAKYDGMPRAAKLTGKIDHELTPEKIAHLLSHYKGVKKKTGSVPTPAKAEDAYHQILSILRTEVGANFTLYKPGTLRRRIARRISATQSTDMSSYADLLRNSPNEAKLLFRDLLISVTEFFRDPAAYEKLEVELLAKLRAKKEGSPFRVWVIGSATGEEPYSIAILLAEILGQLDKNCVVQIFASDLDEHALSIARKGIYPRSSIQRIPKPLVDKYFIESQGAFTVKATIREKVIFARHDICQDPPFLNMDLVSCRNVMIYFAAELQKLVFKTAHYALEKNGLLFLGKSETATHSGGRFQERNKAARIYSRTDRPSELPRSLDRVVRARTEREESIGKIRKLEVSDLYGSMIASFAPDSVVVGDDHQIRHVNGSAGKFLFHPSGEVTHHILKLLPPEISLELASLLHRSRRDRIFVKGREHSVGKAGKKERTILRLSVAPLFTELSKEFLITFETHLEAPTQATPLKKARSSGEGSDDLLHTAQAELEAMRIHLQTVIQEQETTNEELQSLNEEMQSANEELQSSNEELETANEEMQSTNEELTTLNEELNVKSAELISLNQTFQAIQNAIIYPLLIVDRKLRLISFNPAARYLFRINESDVGQSLKAVATHIDVSHIIQEVSGAIESGVAKNLQLSEKERTFEVQLQVFRGIKDVVEGVVISFVENTEIVSALEATRLIKKRLSDIMDNTPTMVTMKDSMGVYTYANRQFAALVGSNPDEVLGRTDDELLGPESSAILREKDFAVSKTRSAVQSEERLKIGGKDCSWASARFPILDQKNRVQSVCTISLDITEMDKYRRDLEFFRRAISAATGGIILFEQGRAGEFFTSFVSEEFSHLVDSPVEALKQSTPANIVRIIKNRSIVPRNAKSKADARLVKIADEIKSLPNYTTTLNIGRAGSDDQWIELRSCRLEDTATLRPQIVLTVSDVTQRERDQRTIVQQQDELMRFGRYSALGEIAAGIAHEINTPLNVVTTKTDMLKRLAAMDKLESHRVIQIASDIDQMAKNISSIVIGLKSLANPETDQRQKVDIRQLIVDTLKVCEFRIHRFGVELTIDAPEKVVIVECYPIQLSQILINLINNSIDAISGFTERWITIKVVEDRDQVSVTVIDCGAGISAEVAEKIMTPFFTTKKDQNGTGIGLSLSRTIARRHGGDLVLDRAHKNTAFRLDLPRKRKRLSLAALEQTSPGAL